MVYRARGTQSRKTGLPFKTGRGLPRKPFKKRKLSGTCSIRSCGHDSEKRKQPPPKNKKKKVKKKKNKISKSTNTLSRRWLDATGYYARERIADFCTRWHNFPLIVNLDGNERYIFVFVCNVCTKPRCGATRVQRASRTFSARIETST